MAVSVMSSAMGAGTDECEPFFLCPLDFLDVLLAKEVPIDAMGYKSWLITVEPEVPIDAMGLQWNH